MVGLGVDVRSVLGEQKDRCRIIVGRGPHQRRLTPGRLPAIGIGAVGQQGPYRLGLASACCGHQQRLTTG